MTGCFLLQALPRQNVGYEGSVSYSLFYCQLCIQVANMCEPRIKGQGFLPPSFLTWGHGMDYSRVGYVIARAIRWRSRWYHDCNTECIH